MVSFAVMLKNVLFIACCVFKGIAYWYSCVALLFAAGVSAALRCLAFLFGPSYLREEAGDYAGTHHADLPDDVKSTGPITD